MHILFFETLVLDFYTALYYKLIQNLYKNIACLVNNILLHNLVSSVVVVVNGTQTPTVSVNTGEIKEAWPTPPLQAPTRP